ncbi:MAG TPA: DUF6756 family protein [Hymenobacter sp.]
MPGFKDGLMQLARRLQLSSEQFDEFGIYDWPLVLRKIEAAFVIKTSSNTHFNWWWESFKGPQYSLFIEEGRPYEYLNQLIDAQEQVWFVACDSGKDPSKFWLFQGQIHAIQSVLREHSVFEYYLVSKKYEWLLCQTHHDVLTGLKSIIPKMEALRLIIKA